jgi:hypothetical protein
MLKIFWGPKMPCSNIADERYVQKINYFYFFFIKFTFQFCNQVYFELLLKQLLMTPVFALEI